MRWRPPFRSLLAQFALRVIAPLTLVTLAMIAAGLFAYQQAVTSLLIERDHQLALLATTSLSNALTSYARELTGLASSAEIRSGRPARQLVALGGAASLSQIFTAGIVIATPNGEILASPAGSRVPVGPLTVADQGYFLAAQRDRALAYSNVLTETATGQPIVVIAVPILDESGRFGGALVGAIDLQNTPLSAPIQQLRLGAGGYAYLVDGHGRVIFHPDAQNIGADFADRPYIQNVIAGETGGTLWQARTGEEVVLGYAPVAGTGWGLIVREPWATVIEPVQTYGVLMGLITLAAVGLSVYLLIQGVRQIARPVRLLADQSARLAAGEALQPLAASGITEIDALEQAFSQMGDQIASYRLGLRRYLEALTQFQETERRRIARELHDETLQNLLSAARRLEFLQAGALSPDQQARLNELQALIKETVQGIRRISRDLRPMILEDLGLIPTLQALVRAAHTGPGAVPHAELEVAGDPCPLTAEQELALYRVAQEALTNIRKHAQATGVQVLLHYAPRQVCLTVDDDGRGFQAPAALTEFAQRESFGLMGIQERVRALGGRLIITATPGGGTHLEVTLPVPPAEHRFGGPVGATSVLTDQPD